MTTEVVAAYRDAVAALERLRVALSEAGLLDAAGPVAPSTPETPEARRRRLKTERQRRWRQRLEVDAGASTERLPVDAAPSTRETPSVYRASTEASTERLHDDPEASTERLQSVYEASTSDPSGPRARARTSSEELISPPCCSLTLTTTPPLTLDGDAERQPTTPAAPSSDAPEATPEATPKARLRSSRRKPMPRERPALPRGAAIDPSPDSRAIPAADRPPAGLGVDLASGDVGRVWSVYAETVGSTRVRLTAPRAALIKRRLRDYTVEELERSIRGYGRSPFHRGENDRGRPYQAIELWLRDAAHVEAGWTYLDAVPHAAKRNGAPQLHGLNAEWAAIERRRETEALHLDVLAG